MAMNSTRESGFIRATRQQCLDIPWIGAIDLRNIIAREYFRVDPNIRLIFLRAWEGRSYGDIACQADYDLGYVRDTDSKLWQMLSEAIATKVPKNNLSAVLQHHLSQNAVVRLYPSRDWDEAVDISVFYGRQQEELTKSRNKLLLSWQLKPIRLVRFLP